MNFGILMATALTLASANAGAVVNEVVAPLVDIEGLVEEKTEGHDISVKMGSAQGIIIKTRENLSEKDTKFRFAGTTIGAAYNMHFSRKLSMLMQAQFLLDLNNSQVVRQGGCIGGAYHLFGGVRRRVDDYSSISFTRRNFYNLSLVGRIAFQNYAASNKKATSRGVSGSVFEFLTGVEFRLDITEAHALGIEGLTNTFTMPASVTRITPVAQEFAVFWRFFI
jgi:hypothetical protein